MHVRKLIMLALAGAVVAGCAANDLQARKDDSWSRLPQTLPDGRSISNPALPTLSKLPDPHWVGYDSPTSYGHVLRPVAMVFYPIAVAFDWAVVRPLHMLGGLAPEWFGMSAEDAQNYHAGMPILTNSKEAPRNLQE